MSALWLILCYLLGSIPFGVIVGKATRGIDIRQYGSGNIGFTNALRVLGWGPALVVSLGDVLKGVVATRLCLTMFAGRLDQELWAVAGGLLSVMGHNWSPFLKFKGGKGMATSAGVLIGLVPLVAAADMVLWVLLVGLTRYVSVASISAALMVPVWMLIFHYTSSVYLALGVLLAVFGVVRHVPNIKHLAAGTELKWGQRIEAPERQQEAERSHEGAEHE